MDAALEPSIAQGDLCSTRETSLPGRSARSVCGQRMAAGSLAPLPDPGLGASSGRAWTSPMRVQAVGGGDHLTPLDGRWEERII